MKSAVYHGTYRSTGPCTVVYRGTVSKGGPTLVLVQILRVPY